MSTQEIVMGQALPPSFDEDERDLFDDIEQVSFQECLKQIFEEYGVSILRKPARAMALIDDADTDQKTRNVFRTILMTDVVGLLVSYAKDELREEELIRRCRSILKEDWGLSEGAFMPVVKQILNAIDSAVKERTDSVGKTICNQLKEMRRQFARANHIEYYEEDCTETKPCAGTCPYCEERTKYLVDEAKKIAAVRDVIYPQFSDVEIRKGQGDSSNEEFSTVGGLREYPIGPDGAV